MRICIVAGARPNFIKVAPLLRVAEKEENKDIECQLVYTGREDDPTLEGSLFDDLQIRRPDAFLGVDCERINELTGLVMSEFDRYLDSHPADCVIVVDDLASTMAAAIVTKKRNLRLAHLVAGTRSFDINMPKEINRLVIDGLSDLLFTAGVGGSNIASREGKEQDNVYMVGNILMDTLRFNHGRLHRPEVMDGLLLSERQYIVFTINRKVLLGDREKLQSLVTAVTEGAGSVPVVAPLRGRAKEEIAEMTAAADNFHIIDPLPYLEFGYLTANALGIVTDSGNVAEEATFNNVPCITLNSYTEHPETVTAGTNVLVGEDPRLLFAELGKMTAGEWKHGSLPDRWDGRTAERIMQILRQ